MIVRTLEQAENSPRCVNTDNWQSVRMLLRSDGMGYSFHITTIHAGTETHIWYQNHLETVYCMEGHGEVETLADGTIHKIEPGTMYALNDNDEHLLRAHKTMKLACVFRPALHGAEVHDENGVYPLEAEEVAAR